MDSETASASPRTGVVEVRRTMSALGASSVSVALKLAGVDRHPSTVVLDVKGRRESVWLRVQMEHVVLIGVIPVLEARWVIAAPVRVGVAILRYIVVSLLVAMWENLEIPMWVFVQSYEE